MLAVRAGALDRAESAVRLVEALDDYGRREWSTWELRVAEALKEKAAAAEKKSLMNLAAPVIVNGEVVKDRNVAAAAGKKIGRSKRLDVAPAARPTAKRPLKIRGFGMQSWVAEWLGKNPGREFTTTELQELLKGAFPESSESQRQDGVRNAMFNGKQRGLVERKEYGVYRAAGKNDAAPTKKNQADGILAPLLTEKEKKYRAFRDGIKTAAGGEEE